MIIKFCILLTEYSFIRLLMASVVWLMAFVIEFARPQLPPPVTIDGEVYYFRNDRDACERAPGGVLVSPCDTELTVYIPNWRSDDNTVGTYLNTTDLRWQSVISPLGQAQIDIGKIWVWGVQIIKHADFNTGHYLHFNVRW